MECLLIDQNCPMESDPNPSTTLAVPAGVSLGLSRAPGIKLPVGNRARTLHRGHKNNSVHRPWDQACSHRLYSILPSPHSSQPK